MASTSMEAPRKGSKILSHLALALGAVVMLLPFYWMLSTALKTEAEAIAYPIKWFPSVPQVHNFLEAWQFQPLWTRYFFNSFFVAITTVVLEVIIAAMAAYAFAKMEFFGKNLIFGLFLATMMVPGEVLLVPNFITLANFGWVDKYPALIVPWVVSVFAIFLLRQHFFQIPKELQEAAFLDGSGHIRFLFQIVLPLSRPALATVALLKFIGSWNAFLWPLLVTNSPEMRTVQNGLSSFMQEAGAHYHIWMAAATLALLPVLVIFLILQKQFYASVARSGLKG
ncbi:MAG TPA: carbohydrate ABC transporter permease [Symbiobacteriaceae bacterium]|nr:carbohydrate ABC transporter permease [Symbiobacteriaceae bacterium]